MGQPPFMRLQKYMDWLAEATRPRKRQGMNFSAAGPVPAQGRIAQQIFWYTAFTSDMTKPGLPVVNEDGTPKWRMAPSPYGAYWSEGMKTRLPGRRRLDHSQSDERPQPESGLALRPVYRLQDPCPFRKLSWA